MNADKPLLLLLCGGGVRWLDLKDGVGEGRRTGSTCVGVRGEMVGAGECVEVEPRGLGWSGEQVEIREQTEELGKEPCLWGKNQ
jgi:hypothetical protein